MNETAHLVQMFDSTWCAPMSRQRAQLLATEQRGTSH
jgi:hypothetical protein